MKRIMSFLTLFALLTCLSGCTSGDISGVSFYYSRSPEQYQYFEEDSVICAESRDLMGHRQDLQYLVGLYLAGPLDEGLSSPFPKAVHLLSVEQNGETINIELTDHSKDMTDSEFSLACACLTMTCTQFSGCTEVTVVSGQRSLTMNADNILLFDTLSHQESNGG